MESGTRTIGGETADYRAFAVSCVDGRSEDHRAWLLEGSKISIYENLLSANSVYVLRHATVAK